METDDLVKAYEPCVIINSYEEAQTMTSATALYNRVEYHKLRMVVIAGLKEILECSLKSPDHLWHTVCIIYRCCNSNMLW